MCTYGIYSLCKYVLLYPILAYSYTKAKSKKKFFYSMIDQFAASP